MTEYGNELNDDQRHGIWPTALTLFIVGALLLAAVVWSMRQPHSLANSPPAAQMSGPNIRSGPQGQTPSATLDTSGVLRNTPPEARARLRASGPPQSLPIQGTDAGAGNTGIRPGTDALGGAPTPAEQKLSPGSTPAYNNISPSRQR